MLIVIDAPSVVADEPELFVGRECFGADAGLVPAIPSCDQRMWPIVRAGDVVVAKERAGLEAWHEADVLDVNGDVLTMRWSGLPDSEVVQRRIWQVALLRIPLNGHEAAS